MYEDMKKKTRITNGNGEVSSSEEDEMEDDTSPKT